MKKLTQDELKEAITKYKKQHPRSVDVNFEGETKRYKNEQLGLDIIENLEAVIAELKTKTQ